MIIKQRIPDFCSGLISTNVDINSLIELMEVDWIKDLCKYDNCIKICYSEYIDNIDLLIMIWKENNIIKHYVIGYIYGNGLELGLEDYIKYM